jgi:hypothetical protein
MAAIGFLIYGLMGYGLYSKVNKDRDEAYDQFVLQFDNGTVIAETFTNDASVCGWAIGVLKYKNIPNQGVVLRPTKVEHPHDTYTKWCRLAGNKLW